MNAGYRRIARFAVDRYFGVTILGVANGALISGSGSGKATGIAFACTKARLSNATTISNFILVKNEGALGVGEKSKECLLWLAKAKIQVTRMDHTSII